MVYLPKHMNNWLIYHEPPFKPMKNKVFGHLKTRLFTIKTSKHVGLGGPWYISNNIHNDMDMIYHSQLFKDYLSTMHT